MAPGPASLLGCEHVATAREIMNERPLTTRPDVPVAELAARLLAQGADGACVLDDGDLVGVVTEMDLIFQEKAVHVPSFITFMDAVIPLELPGKLKAELDKIAGLTVDDIMTREPATVAPDTPASKVAALMVEHGYSIVPVVDGDLLIGAVTRASLLRSAFPSEG